MTYKKERQKDIIRIAIKLFSKKGYDGTSIKELSDQIKLNQAMIYYYFPNKQMLLYTAIMSGLKSLLAQGVKIEKSNLSPREKLECLIIAHVNRNSADKNLAMIINSELRNLTPTNKKILMATRDEYESIFRKVIKDGIQIGEFRQMDYRLMSIFVLSILNYLPRWYYKNGRYSLKKIGLFIIDFIGKGIYSNYMY
jgi:TetR/AcrR family transcriptional regulator, cholesterol catabolism regulator